MTIISGSGSVFGVVSKNIKYQSSDLVVTNGSKTVSDLSLCGVHVDYEQYQKMSVQVPAAITDFKLDFQQLGLKTIFVAITAKYCATNPTLNYLKWKFLPSSDAKASFTSVLTFTATTTAPIPSILIDNPNPDCSVTLEVLFAASMNDYLTDTTAFLYLSGLIYSNIHTFGETNSGILALFNSSNELAGTVNISDILSVNRIPNKTRIVIDDSSTSNDIVLDFLTENDTLQALSAINWVLLDPANRSLPQAQDTTPPVITKSNRVDTGTNIITIDLSTFSGNYTKLNFINDAIASVTDNRDGTIVLQASNIRLVDNSSMTDIVAITATGSYTATVTVSDIAGNVSNATILIDMQAVIVDVTAPVIHYTGAVTSGVIATQDLVTYSGNHFSYNDAKVLAISSVTDNIDGLIPLTSVGTLFFDVNMVPVSSPLTVEGYYTVRFTVQDAHSNIFTQDLTMLLNNSVIDSAPQFRWTGNLNAVNLTATVSLSTNYGSGIGNFTKSDVLARFVSQIIDDVDGLITPLVSMVTILNSVPATISSITVPGSYALVMTVTDSTSHTTMKTINLTVTS